MIGEKFNKLLVKSFFGKNKHGSKLWECLCDCGNATVVNTTSLRNGHTKSCGCLVRESARKQVLKIPDKTTHGMSQNNRFYRIWSQMKTRCKNEKHKSYKFYGGAGISYEESWEEFDSFKEDMINTYTEHSNKYGEKNTTLDRIDNNKGYSKENCRWLTSKKQANNRKNVPFYNYKNESLTMSELAEKYGIKYVTLKHRIRIKGLSIKEAIEKPVRPIKNRSESKCQT